ncbi:MAG: DUF1905 domain-containing protein [Blastocatellia bacterium]
MAKRFRATLEQSESSTATAITIPFDVPKVYGKRGRVAVRGTINGVPFRSSVFKMGDAPYFMVVNRQMREAGGLSAGQTVSVVMERDDEPRSVEVPADLQAALAASQGAQEAWARLSFTHQREDVEAITGAKRPETRARRIAKAVEQLLSGKRS